jgi:xylose isomerase
MWCTVNIFINAKYKKKMAAKNSQPDVGSTAPSVT